MPAIMNRIAEQLLWPWFPRFLASSNGEYCDVCTKMLGTARGIEAICSIKGYRHYDERSCQRSADRGCLLCKIILRHAWENRAAGKRLAGTGLDNLPIYFVSQYLTDIGVSFDPYFNDPRDRPEKWKLRSVVFLEGGFLGDGKGDHKTWSPWITFAFLASDGKPPGLTGETNGAMLITPRGPGCRIFSQTTDL